MAPDSADLEELLKAAPELSSLEIRGLMTVPPYHEDPEKSRPYFEQLRELAERNHLEQLSMGMSHDLEAAIEEGATMVRVGTALFGPRRKE